MHPHSFAYLAVRVLPVLCMLTVGCEPPTTQLDTPTPKSVNQDLLGSWRYDSAGADFYDQRGHFMHRFMEPHPPGWVLTIGPERWTYARSGEVHTYSRHGNTLWLQRLVDSTLVRGGHARAQDLGQPIGFTDTMLITTLTPHRLVVRDSTMDPDSSLFRSWRYYYSR